MSKDIKIRKGLDINLVGEADLTVGESIHSAVYAVKPTDFHGLVPKMLVKEGAKVQVGQALFFDKYNDKVMYASPVSGEVKAVVRGAKRKILEVQVQADQEMSHVQFGPADPAQLSREQVIEKMLQGGVWPFIKQRPFDVVANPADNPKAIFISAFDSHPMAPDFNFTLNQEGPAFEKGIQALKQLTSGKVHLTLNAKAKTSEVFTKAPGVQLNKISGPHPAGNVGVQIHHIDPINKGEVAWVCSPQDVVLIGKLFANGIYDATRTIALTGSELSSTQYHQVKIGVQIDALVGGKLKQDNVRIVSGNPLTGTKVSKDGFLGAYDAQVSVLPEGDELKFLLTTGWLSLGFNKHSNSMSYPSKYMKSKKWTMDTNLNGEERAFVVSGQYEQVFPFDIYPVHLLKAAIVNDIDQMESLGIYEVAPEDFALCEYVCTSKINAQEIVRKGLDVIQVECA